MAQHIVFDIDLIKRYDQTGPRYTSYPTAAQFHTGIIERDYRKWACHSNEDPIPRPLSLYCHIPFCDTVCYYCACTKVVTKNHQRADEYLEYLCREIALQGLLFDDDRIVEQLHWGGGTPTFLDNDQIRKLMDCIARHFPLLSDDSGEYSIEIDPRSVDADKLKVLRESGFNRISLGVQDVNDKVQKAVNRKQSRELTQKITEQARELGFKSINMDLMYGLPLQTVASFEQTLDAVIEMNPDRIAAYNYAHLPERFKPQRRIDEAELPSADEKLALLQHTIEHLTGAGYVYIGMDHFAKPDDELTIAQKNGSLQRNFQGYSTHVDCDLVSVGMSAIGHVCDNYSQNVRKLDEYYELLDAGKLPLERGIELEPDDLLRRDVITRLMCNFVLDIKALESKWHFDFYSHFIRELEDLQTMQADGLLLLEDDILRVLPAGRLLVRNICMVFDRYLRSGNDHSRFSRVI
ncbi:MAG: oxygen-independent coproporphyrinogen III oxidase [Gammaproteobacteria bacterium]|nr:oxygen-independent coproporphyrinogen III oxidase [Gammaproteobacteria bacterium]MDH3887260.1 oxygen-independent coproporphyrinogen III oxidase [Gammaproteobacteria bacterium]MDH3970833.1 oxygen-independent coproporphyrinogen III oxidase [Gammaproteobacteria bacterium]MDH3985132.1 oxygen-independent coproporphyrinogen III oxidase [Gammaproteobacteria bacterium]